MIRGRRGDIESAASMHTQAGGSVRVQFNTAGATTGRSVAAARNAAAEAAALQDARTVERLFGVDPARACSTERPG